MGPAAREAGWSRVAFAYRWQLPLERRAIRALLDLLDPGAADELLDLATGTGAVLDELASRRPRPGRAVGVDLSPAMLRRVGRLPDGWTVEHGDAEALGFDDGRFDCAVAAYLLHLLEPFARARVLGELHRVLRPDARLGVITVAPPGSAVGRALRAPARALAGRSPGPRGGLRGLDPAADLRAAGFEPLAGAKVTRGYTSLCVVARRAAPFSAVDRVGARASAAASTDGDCAQSGT